MPWLLANWKMIALGIITTVAFIAGWEVKGAFVAKEEQAKQKAQEAFIKEIKQSEEHIANILELKLKDLHANEKVIEKAVIKLIDRPVYLNECMDADGVRLVEQARSGKANASKPADKMSGAK